VAIAMPATFGSHTSELGVAIGPVQFSHPEKGATASLQRYYHQQTPQTPLCVHYIKHVILKLTGVFENLTKPYVFANLLLSLWYNSLENKRNLPEKRAQII